MQRARRVESSQRPDVHRGAEGLAPRSTPLTIVSGAVAGDDLERVAGAASDALGRPVAIVLPAAGAPVVSPPGAMAARELRGIIDTAAAMIAGDTSAATEQAVPIRIGREVVGIVATSPTDQAAEESRAWLEATAVGAAVTTLMRTAQGTDAEQSRRALLQAIRLGPPSDIGALLAGARRLGLDLSRGAMAICAGRQAETPLTLPSDPSGLLTEVAEDRLLGLVAEAEAPDLARQLSARGLRVTISAPRRDPALLHDAVREAELLQELPASAQEETYRLLIGVLLRNPEELELLQTQTILPIAEYDARHDTELLATLETFLARHGSTTETAEAMNLHRHTVGYRLARSQEVSGLSPYESDGRERLSLGLKAHQILEAHRRRLERL